MQREIKFRVWCKDYNEWEKDYCFLSQDGLVYQAHKTGIRCIRPDSHVVQFFTGIFDKNSLPVFEGDIVKYDNHPKPVEIRWTEEDHDHHPAWIFVDLYGQYGPYKIIGNIFENSEHLNK